MNNKNKSLETKIYEVLGVKKFKKIVLELQYRALHLIDKNITRNDYYKSSSNYRMKKGNGTKDLKDFKKMLLFNGSIHSFLLVYSFFRGVVGITSVITVLPWIGSIVLNSYCVMLQRYNWIRINHVLRKCEPAENKKKLELCDELKKSEHISDKCQHKIITSKKISDISVDELINISSLQQLRKYRDFLVSIQKNEDKIKTEVVRVEKGKYLRYEYYPYHRAPE